MSSLDRSLDLSISFRDHGNGPVLLLFNGATLPLEFWDPVAEPLTEKFRVVRFDQRNAGGTVFNGTFTLNDTAADAASVLDHLGVESANLVGHAWGGRAAQVFARDYPHRVDSMVLCGTGGQLPATVEPETLRALRQAFRDRRRTEWERALESTFCANGFRKRAPASFQEISELLWGQIPRSGARWDDRVSPSPTYWGSSAANTLLIYGREDKNGTPENARDLLGRLATARLEFIEQAGHFVVRETPEHVVQLIEEFMMTTAS